MRNKFLILFLLTISTYNCYSQNTVSVDAQNIKLLSQKEDKKSSIIEVTILLPEKSFEKLVITINKKRFSFKCEDNAKDSCINLFASDIDSGKVLFSFNAGVLKAIGKRPVTEEDAILTGQDTLRFDTTNIIKRSDPLKNAKVLTLKFPIGTKTDVKKTALVPSNIYKTTFCKKDTTCKGDSTINGLPDFSFLCGELAKEKCACGIPVKSPFEKMYLPPCFDKYGNAVSVSNQLLYDMTQLDGNQKSFLLEIKKKKIDPINDCVVIKDGLFEFASVQKRMSLRAGDLIAVSVIAHKDSSIIIDSNDVNYFLDSADAVQKAFNSISKGGAATAVEPKKDSSTLEKFDKPKSALDYLSGSVTLQGDLLSFNQSYSATSFVLEKYRSELICMQNKIAEYFELKYIPSSGEQLATSIEQKLKNAKLECRFYQQACQLLQQIADEYNRALQQQADYRMYTQVIEVPNSDEISIGMRTKNTTKPLFKKNFLIRGGLKIDFSTGVFLTGLNSVDFINTSQRFTYQDSASATPRDTIGTLIAKNSKKFNFNTGFMVHVYPRTGKYYNFGGVAGVTFNNSEFTMMAGASAMFRMGKARIAFVGGLAFGKEKTLDANQQQYLYNTGLNSAGKIYVQNNPLNRLPRFFSETNISTYDKLKVSWFAGITYNFAGLNLGK